MLSSQNRCDKYFISHVNSEGKPTANQLSQKGNKMNELVNEKRLYSIHK